MSPSDPAAHDALQQSADLLAQRRPRAARALLVDLLAEAPLHVTAQMLLAKACEASGDPEAALTAWHQAFFLVPTSPVVQRERQRLAGMLAQQVTSPLPQPLVPPLPRREITLPPVETDVLLFDFGEPQEDAPTAPTTLDEAAAERLTTAEEAPTPTEAAGQEPGGHVAAHEEALPTLDFDNLDALIEQLEQAPRIVPDPDFEVPEAPPAANDAIADDMVSETLARIFVAQDRVDEAIEVYETLALREPHRRSEWLTRAEELRRRFNRPTDDTLDL